MKKQPLPAKASHKVPRPKGKVPRPPVVTAPQPPNIKKSAPPRPEVKEESVSYWRNVGFYLLAFIGAVLLFGICAWLVRRQILLGREVALFKRINDWPEKLRIGFVAITALGSFWMAATMVASAFILRLYQLAWRLALSVFAAYGLLVILKEFFARPRPEQFIGDIHVRVLETSMSFPSAHAAIATVLALTLRTYLPMPAVWQWLVVLVWIGGVAASRMYLGVHTPLDVAAGVALGAGVVYFWHILPTPIKRALRLK